MINLLKQFYRKKKSKFSYDTLGINNNAPLNKTEDTVVAMPSNIYILKNKNK